MGSKSTQAAKPAVFAYARSVMVRRKDKTIDVCDPQTGVWANFKTERHAKWSATVYANLCEKFGHHLSTDIAIDQYVRQAERAYPHLAGE